VSEDWRADLHAELSAGRRKPGPRLYDTPRWRAARRELTTDAACVLCLRFGEVVRGNIADHVVPTRNSTEDFHDARLQPVCEGCHRIKAKLEHRWRRGELPTSELDLAISKEAARLRAPIGTDGMPIPPLDQC
jgi:5-methylcytosine-specific restriction endonuclease McrA